MVRKHKRDLMMKLKKKYEDLMENRSTEANNYV